MSKKKKETRGGKRPNAGRKPSLYKTTTVGCRIRVEWADEMRKYIADKKIELEARKQLASHNVLGQSEQIVCVHCKGSGKIHFKNTTWQECYMCNGVGTK